MFAPPVCLKLYQRESEKTSNDPLELEVRSNQELFLSLYLEEVVALCSTSPAWCWCRRRCVQSRNPCAMRSRNGNPSRSLSLITSKKFEWFLVEQFRLASSNRPSWAAPAMLCGLATMNWSSNLPSEGSVLAWSKINNNDIT